MTIDERIERLEFLNAAYVDQRRKDWEEYLVREKDLRSHIEAIWKNQERRDEQQRLRNEELDKRWSETQDKIADTNRESNERVEKLVIAIGKFISSAARSSKLS